MKNSMLSKTLVIGILILFIGMSVVSSIGYTTIVSNLSGINSKMDSQSVLLDENFSGTFPPEGWSTDLWAQSYSSFAEGEPPEAYCNLVEKGDGYYYHNYITSKAVNASNFENVTLMCKYRMEMEYIMGKQFYGYFYIKYRKNSTSPWENIAPWDNPLPFIGPMNFTIYIDCGPNGCGDALQVNWSCKMLYPSWSLYGIWLDDVKILGNNPPYEPSDPIPPDGVENWTVYVGLSWTGGDPDGDDVMYDVYFGNSSPPPQISANLTENHTDPSPDDPLEFNTTYYWKIVAWDEHGASTEGPIWTFTTEPNYPPDPAKNPIPPDGADNVPPIVVTLYWNGSDPNSGDTLTYDVYFGPNNPPAYKTTQEENYWETYELPLLKDFYWRIDTRDREGLQTNGSVWSFRTGLYYLTEPEINGPNRGMPGIDYDFTFVSTHPDDQNISYYVDWGDKTNSGWTSFHYAGEEITLNHTWSKKGTYIIKAKAKNIYDEESHWSEHEINIPRNRAVNFNINLLSWLFDRFPFLEVFLRAMNLLR